MTRNLARALFLSFLAILGPAGPLSGDDAKADKPAKEASKAAAESGLAEVLFHDNGNLKLVLKEQAVTVATPYGKLLIPVADIHQIDFALRIPPDVAKRVEAAVVNLGAKQYRVRETASAELAKLGIRAYPALQRAAKHDDKEVARRAGELLDKLREEMPEELLAIPENDVVVTHDSKFTGRIEGAMVWPAQSAQFGEVQVKISDVRTMRFSGKGNRDDGNAAPDPGTVTNLYQQVGKVFSFRVTGAGAGAGGVWGTDVYTVDSTLAVAAVHAGVLKAGETGVVRVKIVGPNVQFQPSARNGIVSGVYGPYPGFRFVK